MSDKIETHTAAGLIELAVHRPPRPIVKDLLNVGDIGLLHGAEESFKSAFVVQLAEALATGTTFLRQFEVVDCWTVGLIETEIHESQLGVRLKKMFPETPPANLRIMGERGLKSLRRCKTLKEKVEFVHRWVNEQGIQVLIIDTANDFFRGDDNPSSETDVGTLFDLLRNMPVEARILVRHDRKQKGDDQYISNSNERIRGSGEWKEDPELILYLERADRRTQEVAFEVGKFRYGSKPEPCKLWFDAGTFRLTPLPPVIALLESGGQYRHDLVEEGKARFGLSERKIDSMISDHLPVLRELKVGHNKMFEIDWSRIETQEWAGFVKRPAGRGEDMQVCTIFQPPSVSGISAWVREWERCATLHKSYPHTPSRHTCNEAEYLGWGLPPIRFPDLLSRTAEEVIAGRGEHEEWWVEHRLNDPPARPSPCGFARSH